MTLTRAEIKAAMLEADWPPSLIAPMVETKLVQFAEIVQRRAGSAPVDMVLFCPSCLMQHIDAPEEHLNREFLYSWENPPHRSHLCAYCGHIWRPADVATNGVAAITTKGKRDSPIVTPSGRVVR